MTGAPLNFANFGFEQHLNSLIVKQIEKGVTDVRIFMASESRAFFDYGHS